MCAGAYASLLMAITSLPINWICIHMLGGAAVMTPCWIGLHTHRPLLIMHGGAGLGYKGAALATTILYVQRMAFLLLWIRYTTVSTWTPVAVLASQTSSHMECTLCLLEVCNAGQHAAG